MTTKIKIENIRSIVEHTSIWCLLSNRETPTRDCTILATLRKEERRRITWAAFVNCQEVDVGMIILVWSPRIILSNFLTDAGHQARDKLIDATDNMKGKWVILFQP